MYPGRLHKAVFVERINRFVATVHNEGRIVECHLPNPGRMVELLIPWTSFVLIRFADPESKRKTQASIVATFTDEEVVNLDTTIFSRFLQYEFRISSPLLANWKIISREITIGDHRFDFLLLDSENREIITEIKSTTRVQDNTACFPDATSKRAREHVRKLTQLQVQGRDTMIMFLVYRRAAEFTPCKVIDPLFAKIFEKAQRAGVSIKIFQVHSEITSQPSGIRMHLGLSHEIRIKK